MTPYRNERLTKVNFLPFCVLNGCIFKVLDAVEAKKSVSKPFRTKAYYKLKNRGRITMDTNNKMGEQPIKTLMLSMGIPFIVSMVMQGLYNIVDSAFVANMRINGEEAVNALTLAFPIQILFISCAVGTGIGANALLSQNLGRGDRKRASHIAGNTFILGIFIFAIFVLFALFGASAYIKTQTDNPIIFEMAVAYLKICCLLSFGNIYFGLFEKLLQATGHPLCSTISQLTGAVINIILDPIMIYGLLGVPEMGVKGAAYATVIGQVASAVMGLIFYIKYTTEIDKSRKYFRLSGKIVKEIYKIGVPAIIMQAMSAVMTYALNLVLVNISEAMVTAYGIFYKIQQIVLFAIFGLRDAITPIVAFSYGKNDPHRLKEGVRYGLLYTIIISLLGTIIIEILAVWLTNVFGLSGVTAGYCISAFRIVSISFVFAGTCIALQGVFQAISCGKQSLVITLLRQLILIVPVAYGFSRLIIANPDLSRTIWLTFLIAEVLTSIVAILMYVKKRKSFS